LIHNCEFSSQSRFVEQAYGCRRPHGACNQIVRIMLMILSVASPAALAAQSCLGFSNAMDSMFTYTKQLDEVNVRFTVTDHKGHFVSDLSPDDFRLLDNDEIPEKIRYFQKQSELPLRVGILIDASASIRHRLSFEKKGAKVFLQKILRPNVDEAFVLTFDE